MRYELPIFLASAFLFAAYAGCSGNENKTTTGTGTTSGTGGAGGTGGATTTTTTTKTKMATTTTGPASVTIGSGTTQFACEGDPDGLCSPDKGETCDCPDCEGSAFCAPDTCNTDGYCSSVWDSCICPDCDLSYKCENPNKKNCTDDGVCDSYHEGCLCADCAMKPDCLDNRAACSGGVPDGVCDLNAEPCTCVDCFGRPGCVPCIADSLCDPSEACYCKECKLTAYCASPDVCVDDGVCNAFDEGCQCKDCQYLLECGGMGSTSGAGGMTTSMPTGTTGTGP